MRSTTPARLALLAGGGLIALGGSPAWAQGEQTLPTVQVTSTVGQFDNQPFTEKQKATATNDIVYDQAAIETSSAVVLSDFLAEQGIGVYKSPTDYGHTLLTIRGFRTDHLSKELDGHVLFLIDGRRTGTNNPSQIPMLNVERVEILRGPEMLRYSGAAAGGVINVVTKKGGPDKLAARVEAGFGSYDYKKGQVKLNGLVNGFDYSLGYMYSDKGDYEDASGNRVYHSSVKANNSLVANLGYTFNERHRIGWATYYYKVDEAKRPSYTDYVDDVVYGPSFMDRYNISNSLTYDWESEDGRLSWQAAYTFGENWSKQYSIGEGANPMAAKFDRDVFQASVTYNDELFRLTGGFEYLDYDTEEGAPASRNAAGVLTSRGRPMVPTGRYQNTAAYLTGDLKLLEDTLILSAALRYDYYKVSDKRQDFGTVINGATLNDDPTGRYGHKFPWNQKYHHLSPSFGVSYLPVDWLKLRANYTNSFRPPSPRELTSGAYEPYNYWGYPWNKAEKTDTYEGGFDVNLRHLDFSATYFWSYTEDYVYQHVDPDQDHARVRNSDRQYRSGVELQLSGNLAGALGYDSFELKPYINYSHLFKLEELYREGRKDSYGNWADITGQIPRTSLGAGVRFRHPEAKLSANLNFSYWGRALYTVTNRPNQWAGGFTVADLSIRKGLLDFGDKGDIELRVDINNLFNKDYVYGNPNDATAYHMPGRNYYVGLAYNF